MDEQTLIDFIADTLRPKISKTGIQPRWWCLREELKEGARVSAIDAVMRWKAGEDLVARKYSRADSATADQTTGSP